MLWFWVIVLVVIIGAIAVVAAGRGDSMEEVYDDRPDASLPTGRPLTAEDLRELRLNTGVRGYRMDEVDALLDRLQAEMLMREAEDAPAAPRAAHSDDDDDDSGADLEGDREQVEADSTPESDRDETPDRAETAPRDGSV